MNPTTAPPIRLHTTAGSHLSTRHRLVAVLASAVIAVGVLTGCGTSKSSTAAVSGPAATSQVASGQSTAAADCTTAPGADIKHAKIKFVLHAGLAFGAFHRYLYKPFKAGTFHHGAHGRIRTILKAGIAVVFIHHELRLALADAKADPTLSKLVAPFTALDNKIKATVSSLVHGSGDATSANTALESARGQAAVHGASINDQDTSNLPATCAA